MSVRRQAHEHLLPHFTKGAAWQSDHLGIIERGEGCYVWDTDGVEYLDGLAGLFCTNIGHGRKDLTAAAADQMERLAFFPNWGWATPPAVEAASMIAERAPGDLDTVFFVNSGSEAAESALKLVRSFHLSRGDDQRDIFLSREWAYHGTTLGALGLTGIPKLSEPFRPLIWDGVRRVPNTLNDTADELSSARAVEDAILEAGPERVAAVFAEPVQNGRGALVPPDGYWQELRRICDRHGVLLVADEVINSFGRLGHWFGSERMGVVPDIITFAKGVTSAYAPLGGLVARREVVESVWESELGGFLHGATFGGHPVSTAVAVANIQAMDDEGVLDNVLAMESMIRSRLDALAGAHPCVKEVRGTGYFYAIELMADRATGRELSEAEHAELRGGVLGGFVRDARLIIRPDDRGATMLTVSPPLIADSDVLTDMVERLDQVLTRTDRWLAGSR